MLVLLTTAGAAHAVSKCQSPTDTLYTAGACPSGYKNVTSSMRGNVTTVTKSATLRKDETQYLQTRAQLARQIQNTEAREDEMAWRAQNAFWNQCRVLEYQARASERAMQQTEYWSRADRYRDAVRALRAEQYDMGCFY